MFELTADNAPGYLQSRGFLPTGSTATVTPLAWGVSNLVLRVEPEGLPAVVVKQSQPRLRTKIDWFSRCERIHREADVLRAISPLLPPGVVPAVRFEARADYVLGLEAIRADHEVWKAALLGNRVELTVAARLGTYLATMHRDTANRPTCLPDAADWSLFDELRIDPFYRWIARVHPAIQPAIDDLIAEMSRHRVCLVHADFSPKNVLVHPDGVSLVDFETGHFGDPAFDVGFFLSHLLLKSLRQRPSREIWRQLVATFREHYAAGLEGGPDETNPADTSRRAVRHLAACLLARVDGKSPVDYLDEPWQPEFVRRLTCRWLGNAPAELEAALEEYWGLKVEG